MGYRLRVTGYGESMKKGLGILVLAGMLMGCQHASRYWKDEAQAEPQHVEIVRFDNAILGMKDDVRGTKEKIEALYAQYPEFMSLWVEDILGVPTEDTAFLVQNLPLLVQDTLYVPKREQELFADINDLQGTLDKAFTRLKYVDPELRVPTIYWFISGYNNRLYFNGDIIGVGADMYLGSDFPIYDMIATVYSYQKQTMRKECIPVDILNEYLYRNMPYTSNQERLLDLMIYHGKIRYLTAQILDDYPEYEVMGWTKEQWDWCEANEEGIWHHMMDQKHIFSMDHMVQTNYLKEGPFTLEISQEYCPGQVGVWIGWQIVASYMEQNEDVTLLELMAEGDAQKVLDKSYYRP